MDCAIESRSLLARSAQAYRRKHDIRRSPSSTKRPSFSARFRFDCRIPLILNNSSLDLSMLTLAPGPFALFESGLAFWLRHSCQLALAATFPRVPYLSKKASKMLRLTRDPLACCPTSTPAGFLTPLRTCASAPPGFPQRSTAWELAIASRDRSEGAS